MHEPLITPEAVPLDLEVATVGSRGAAILLDLTIMGTVLIVLAIAQGVLDLVPVTAGWVGVALLLLVVFALQFGYPIGFETLWRGRTPGKAALGLRVVTVEGAPVGLRHATIRAAVGLLELTATLGAVAAITSLLSSRGQRLGDMAAGTVVIRERRASRALATHRFAAPPGDEAYVAQLDVSALGPAEYATVRDLLTRAGSLPTEIRAQVAREVAGALAPRVTPPPPGGMDPLRWLACVAAAVQARRAGMPGAAPPQPPPGPAPQSLPTPPGSWPSPTLPGPPRPPSSRRPESPPAREHDDGGGFAPPS